MGSPLLAMPIMFGWLGPRVLIGHLPYYFADRCIHLNMTCQFRKFQDYTDYSPAQSEVEIRSLLCFTTVVTSTVQTSSGKRIGCN